MEDVCVDNVTSRTKTIKQGKTFYEKAKLILSEAGCNLKKRATKGENLLVPRNILKMKYLKKLTYDIWTTQKWLQ